jgi:hypothetical protein
VTPSRRLALLGGTTTLGDCPVALRYMADPRKMIDGPVIEEYEQDFACQVGVAHGASFGAGRVGFYGLLRALGVREGDEVLLHRRQSGVRGLPPGQLQHGFQQS